MEKGNWERHNDDLNEEHIWCGDEHIADFDGKNANANAKLCVVAPLLYEALEELMYAVRHGKSQMKGRILGVQALAKVKEGL